MNFGGPRFPKTLRNIEVLIQNIYFQGFSGFQGTPKVHVWNPRMNFGGPLKGDPQFT